ncbi:DNA polymerase III subunit epsilon [Peristeroidobacter soli]|uniref:DNA polymerase III subunit epsilon n=1 Tax=Peristeroidobacter soli TaxID=2497877 RepID=UPI00101BCB0E|nr:DNA polymerase III subunit epsilon [Peristeroidobacter soli]
MRQIILDTETTGLEPEQGHRIIEIGCVEMMNRRKTGRTFHRYLRPDREVDRGAIQVHGLTNEFLAQQPRFADVVDELIEFISGAELIIHNAAFDLAFLDAEFKRLPGPPRQTRKLCNVIDTLPLARQMHPGQRNSLDALCKRYEIDNSHRELHGALLDAQILLEVYLAMTGGQTALILGEETAASKDVGFEPVAVVMRPRGVLRVLRATEEELVAHERMLTTIDKSSGGKTLFKQLALPEIPPAPVPAAAQPAAAMA